MQGHHDRRLAVHPRPIHQVPDRRRSQSRHRPPPRVAFRSNPQDSHLEEILSPQASSRSFLCGIVSAERATVPGGDQTTWSRDVHSCGGCARHFSSLYWMWMSASQLPGETGRRRGGRQECVLQVDSIAATITIEHLFRLSLRIILNPLTLTVSKGQSRVCTILCILCIA